LDSSTLPVWTSYAELRKGSVTLFNDIVYSNLEGSKGFAASGPLGLAVLGGTIGVDYQQLVVEL
jgi:hypothetical protein